MKKIALIPLLVAALLAGCTGNHSSAEEESVVVEPSFKLANGEYISKDDIEERSPAAHGKYFYYLKIKKDSAGDYIVTIPKLVRNAHGTYTNEGNLKASVPNPTGDLTLSGSSILSMYLKGTPQTTSGEDACSSSTQAYSETVRLFSLNTTSGHVLAIQGGNTFCFMAMDAQGDIGNMYAYTYNESTFMNLTVVALGDTIKIIDTGGSGSINMLSFPASEIFTGNTGSSMPNKTLLIPPFPEVNAPMVLRDMATVKINGVFHYVLLYYGIANENTVPIAPLDFFPYLPKLVLMNPEANKMVSIALINVLFNGPVETFSISDEGRLYLSGMRLPATTWTETSPVMGAANSGWVYNNMPHYNTGMQSLYRVNGPTIPQMPDLIQQLLAAPGI